VIFGCFGAENGLVVLWEPEDLVLRFNGGLCALGEGGVHTN